MFDNEENNHNGDYIRPTEEYRAECTDEHGITYENHDDEQHSYDAYNEAEGEFSSMLMSGEHILWAAKGSKKIALSHQGGIVTFIFSVFWLGFTLFWTFTATKMGGPFGLFGLPFVLVGIGLVKTSFRTKNRSYAITNMRVIRKEKKKISIDRLDLIMNMSLRRNNDGTGDITYFVNGLTVRSKNGIVRNVLVGISGVNNPDEVYRILNEAIYMSTYLR